MSTENLTETTTPTPPVLSNFDNRGVLYNFKDNIARQNSEEAKTLAEEAKTLAEEAKTLAENLSSEDSEEDAATSEKMTELDYLAHYNFRIQQIMSEATTIVDGKAIRPAFAVTNVDDGEDIYDILKENGRFSAFNYLFLHPKFVGAVNYQTDTNDLVYVLLPKGVTAVSGITDVSHVLDLTLFTGDSSFPALTASLSSVTFTKILVPSGRKNELISDTNWAMYADNVEEVVTW